MLKIVQLFVIAGCNRGGALRRLEQARVASAAAGTDLGSYHLEKSLW